MRQTRRPPLRRTLRQRFEFGAARMLFSLPAAVQVRLSGRPPVVVDDCALHPQMQLLLALRNLWRGPSISEQPLDEARANFRNDTATIAGRPIAVGAVTDIAIEAAHGPIATRHYAPAGGSARPLLVYYHGGGFVLGDLDGHDRPVPAHCRDRRHACALGRLRLAPEHRFPAAVDDAFAALPLGQRARGGARRLPDSHCGRRRQRRRQPRGGGVAEGGWRRASPRRARQILLYPALDRTVDRRSLVSCSAKAYLIGRARHRVVSSSVHSARRLRAAGTSAQNRWVAKDFAGLAPGADRYRRLRPLARRGRSLCRRAAAGRRAGGAEALRRDAARLRQHGDDQPGLRRGRQRDHRGAAHADRPPVGCLAYGKGNSMSNATCSDFFLFFFFFFFFFWGGGGGGGGGGEKKKKKKKFFFSVEDRKGGRAQLRLSGPGRPERAPAGALSVPANA